MAELQFAGTEVLIDEVVVAKITSFTNSISVDEIETTGSEDVLGTAPNQVSQKVYVPAGVDETCSFEAIAVPDDAGQGALETAARTGQRDVVLSYEAQDGNGAAMTGFFTAFEKTGSVGDTWKFSGTFRVNSVEAITAAT